MPQRIMVQLTLSGGITHHGCWIVRKHARHRLQITDVPVYHPEQGDDRGLVCGDRIEIAHLTESVGPRALPKPWVFFRRSALTDVD
jgi:hypothetical protein